MERGLSPEEDPGRLPTYMNNKRNMLEIFNFYCNKFLVQKGDFDILIKNRSVLGLNGFVAFCKDFKLPATNTNIIMTWKKFAVNQQPHNFE